METKIHRGPRRYKYFLYQTLQHFFYTFLKQSFTLPAQFAAVYSAKRDL